MNNLITCLSFFKTKYFVLLTNLSFLSTISAQLDLHCCINPVAIGFFLNFSGNVRLTRQKYCRREGLDESENFSLYPCSLRFDQIRRQGSRQRYRQIPYPAYLRTGLRRFAAGEGNNCSRR